MDRLTPFDIVGQPRMDFAIVGVFAAWEWHIAEARIVGDSGFATLYDLTPEQAASGVSPAAFLAILHPEDQVRMRLAIGAMLRGAEVFSKEYRLLLPDGSMRWVHGRGRCHFDEDDRPTRFSGALVDITEQKRVEERLRIAQTAGGVGTFEHMDGFATASVSAQFCALLGLHPARDLPVLTINMLVHQGDPPIVEIMAPRAPGATPQTEFRITRPDNGVVRWLTRCGEYLRDAETAGLRFSGVIYDITDAKRTEELLRNLNDTLEARVEERTRERDRVWQVSRDLHIVCEPDGTCRSANPAWQSEMGYDAADLRGLALRNLIHPDDRKAMDAAIAKLASGGFVDNLDARVLCKDGRDRAFSWTCVPERGAFFAAGRDITQRNELEERLRQGQKMEAIGQLTGGIAHDFNNLLTGIIGALNIIRRRLAAGRTDDVLSFMDAATSSAHRAAALTHRLLAFGRRQSLDTKACDVGQLVAGMEDLLHRTLGEQVRLQTVLVPDLWAAHTDANQLENAILNLAINARDAMPEGGLLSIETANIRLDAAYASRNADVSAGDYVEVSVRDTGTGMPPDVVAKVFDPFFTTKPIGQGTGLGLSMIYGFVKQSAGHVRVDSTVGCGTTIRLFLRRAADATVEVETGEPPPPPPRGHGETVLVVEDDETVRLLMTTLLRELGYTHLQAPDGNAALDILRSGQRIDLLVTDVGLPHVNGRQVAEIARETVPNLKVLFVTGYAEKATVRGGFLETGMDMLMKPFDLDAFATKIREMLEG